MIFFVHIDTHIIFIDTVKRDKKLIKDHELFHLFC
jgi:hypothetical protein